MGGYTGQGVSSGGGLAMGMERSSVTGQALYASNVDESSASRRIAVGGGEISGVTGREE